MELAPCQPPRFQWEGAPCHKKKIASQGSTSAAGTWKLSALLQIKLPACALRPR